MKRFIRCAMIRALKTFCQTLLATIGTSIVLSDVDWLTVLSAAALASVLSILTSICTGLPESEVIDGNDN